MYLGANPWIALKVIKITLKSIRDLIGNHCSSNRNGDVWQNLGARKTSLSAILIGRGYNLFTDPFLGR